MTTLPSYDAAAGQDIRPRRISQSSWNPESDVVGIAAVLTGTISIAIVAMFFAFPLSLLTALFISEYAPERAKATLVAMVDLMAAVPSIVYGLWGYLLVMPHAGDLAVWLQRNLGWLPFFDVRGADPDAAVVDASRYVCARSSPRPRRGRRRPPSPWGPRSGG